MKVINPETKIEFLHLASTEFNDRKKKADAAIIAIVPIQKVIPTKSPAAGTSPKKYITFKKFSIIIIINCFVKLQIYKNNS
jgi:hypothetical protein